MLDMELITEKKFEPLVINSEKPALVFFSADWSGASFLTELAIDKVYKSLSSVISFYKIDLAEGVVELGEHKITLFEVPTLMLYNNGELVFRHNGIINKEQLMELLEESLINVK